MESAPTTAETEGRDSNDIMTNCINDTKMYEFTSGKSLK